MGIKKKWKDDAENNILIYLERIAESIDPFFDENGLVELSRFNKENSIALLLAFILNCKFINSKDNRDAGFGADDVMPVKVIIEEHKRMKYWGKIYWLSLPKGHESFRPFQDPFMENLN